ncbi:MAG: cell division protein ZapA [Bacteroidales bacterium]|nr:cell division protein ZapA [Bacteroidales bacterium]
MAQDITLKVAGKPYRLSAASPEMEQLMRLAAAEVSEMVTKFDARFPDSSPEDKLVFVAIQEAAGKLSAQKKMSRLVEEVEALQGDVNSYLEGITKK